MTYYNDRSQRIAEVFSIYEDIFEFADSFNEDVVRSCESYDELIVESDDWNDFIIECYDKIGDDEEAASIASWSDEDGVSSDAEHDDWSDAYYRRNDDRMDLIKETIVNRWRIAYWPSLAGPYPWEA